MPTEIYRAQPTDRSRTLIHTGNWSERLPKILVDSLRARPIDFCVIDGISTIDQGEGPWNHGQAGISLRTVRPEILIAGRNPVAVDAVGAACMGFDPEALPFTDGFLSGWNHLALASAVGLGPNALDEIDVLGLPIAHAAFPFTPCPNQSGITPTPTVTPTITPTSEATETPTSQPTETATPQPTETATPQPTETATPQPTETPVPGRAWLPLIKGKSGQ